MNIEQGISNLEVNKNNSMFDIDLRPYK